MELDPTESKSAFARRCRVNASQVTRWIEGGIIGRDATVGEGRNARIRYDLAARQVATRRDQGQVLGNGARTKVTARPGAPRSRTMKPPDHSEPEPLTVGDSDELDPGSPDYQAQRARLVRAQAEAQEMKNALARNELATVAAVEHKIGVRNAAIRSRLLALPGRIRADIPRLTETEIKIVDTAVRAILKELVHG